MKILKKIWSILKELNKLIFGFDLADKYNYCNLYDDNNNQKIIIVRNEKDNELLINQLNNENKRNDLIVHYTAGDNNQKEKIKQLQDKDWKWNS